MTSRTLELLSLIVAFILFASIIVTVMILPIRPYQEGGMCTNLTDVVSLNFNGDYPIVDYLEKNQTYWLYWHYECMESEHKLKLLHRIESKDHCPLWGQKEGYVLYPHDYLRWWVR